MMAVFRQLDPRLRSSITFDTAFAQHSLLASACAMATWSCDAYACWQKGAVENANGRLQRDRSTAVWAWHSLLCSIWRDRSCRLHLSTPTPLNRASKPLFLLPRDLEAEPLARGRGSGFITRKGN
jgi:hypothetical protein